jgi:hypothetical protein
MCFLEKSAIAITAAMKLFQVINNVLLEGLDLKQLAVCLKLKCYDECL